MCTNVLPACLPACMYHVHARCLERSERESDPDTGIKDDYKLPC